MNPSGLPLRYCAPQRFAINDDHEQNANRVSFLFGLPLVIGLLECRIQFPTIQQATFVLLDLHCDIVVSYADQTGRSDQERQGVNHERFLAACHPIGHFFCATSGSLYAGNGAGTGTGTNSRRSGAQPASADCNDGGDCDAGADSNFTAN
jgi:hypothetical protein